MPFASSEIPPVYPRCSTHCKLHLVFYLPELQMFDDLQRSLLADIANIRLDANNPAWAQAVLPVWSGGLGVWSASQLALSAFWPQLLAPSSSPTRSSQQGYRRHPVLLSMWPSPSGPVGMMSLPLPFSPSLFPPEFVGCLSSENGIQGSSGVSLRCTCTGSPASSSCKGVRSMATCPPCVLVGAAYGQRGGTPLRGHTVPSTCLPACHNQVDHQGLHGLHRPSFLCIII